MKKFTPAQILVIFLLFVFLLPMLACGGTDKNSNTCNFNDCAGNPDVARQKGFEKYVGQDGSDHFTQPGLTDGLNGSTDSEKCGLEYVDGAFVTVCK